MLPLLVMLADADRLVATARERLAAERRCQPSSSTDVTVCGRRRADRFRVPFVGYDPGDPRGESVAAERVRLLNRTNACQERRAIMVGCGSVGVHATVDARGAALSDRTLAP